MTAQCPKCAAVLRACACGCPATFPRDGRKRFASEACRKRAQRARLRSNPQWANNTRDLAPGAAIAADPVSEEAEG